MYAPLIPASNKEIDTIPSTQTRFTLEEIFPGSLLCFRFRVFGFVGVYTEIIFGSLTVYTQRQLREHS